MIQSELEIELVLSIMPLNQSHLMQDRWYYLTRQESKITILTGTKKKIGKIIILNWPRNVYCNKQFF